MTVDNPKRELECPVLTQSSDGLEKPYIHCADCEYSDLIYPDFPLWCKKKKKSVDFNGTCTIAETIE